jgi:predicted kinase
VSLILKVKGTANMGTSGRLIFFCGKMAAGKSTFARKLAGVLEAFLLVQDDLLSTLFPDEIIDIPSFVERYSKLKKAMTPHICDLLSKGNTVVLDFAAATRSQRAWFRELIEHTQAEHELHLLVVPDAVCLTQLQNRSRGLARGAPWTTAEDFPSN